MATFKEKATDLYGMVFQGQLLEAFEKYYDDAVVMKEIGEAPRVGKDANREYEKKFIASVKEVHGAGIKTITSDEEKGIVTIENWMDITFQDGNRLNYEQVCIQEWSGDKIMQERFYHK